MDISQIEDYTKAEMNGDDQEVMKSLLIHIQSIINSHTKFNIVTTYQAELFRRGVSKADFLNYAEEELCSPLEKDMRAYSHRIHEDLYNTPGYISVGIDTVNKKFVVYVMPSYIKMISRYIKGKIKKYCDYPVEVYPSDRPQLE